MRLARLNEMSVRFVVLLNCGRIIGRLRNPLIVKQGHSPASACRRLWFSFSFHLDSLLLLFTPIQLSASSLFTELFCGSICLFIANCKLIRVVIEQKIIGKLLLNDTSLFSKLWLMLMLIQSDSQKVQNEIFTMWQLELIHLTIFQKRGGRWTGCRLVLNSSSFKSTKHLMEAVWPKIDLLNLKWGN